MYCSSELAKSYSYAAHQFLHVKSYSCAEHTKSNSRVAVNSDSSATREVKLACRTHKFYFTCNI